MILGIQDLSKIGFYTLSNERALTSNESSPLWRCELILTNRCNFRCPYCRGLRSDIAGVLSFADAKRTLDVWITNGLKNVRFSGGEPCLYPHLKELVRQCRSSGVERIAVSTNGSLSFRTYQRLLDAGVDDFSISLDGCCASVGDVMSGVPGMWARVVENIKRLSTLVYVSVGMVFTEDNIGDVVESVRFAASLGVSDIRVIPSAQYNKALKSLAALPDSFLSRFPILRYRIHNIYSGVHVRGIDRGNRDRCWLGLDDMAVAAGYHFPCIIYMREGGTPIGKMNDNVRRVRAEWVMRHKPWTDPICSRNCLDVCRDHNALAATSHCMDGNP